MAGELVLMVVGLESEEVLMEKEGVAHRPVQVPGVLEEVVRRLAWGVVHRLAPEAEVQA